MKLTTGHSAQLLADISAVDLLKETRPNFHYQGARDMQENTTLLFPALPHTP